MCTLMERSHKLYKICELYRIYDFYYKDSVMHIMIRDFLYKFIFCDFLYIIIVYIQQILKNKS